MMFMYEGSARPQSTYAASVASSIGSIFLWLSGIDPGQNPAVQRSPARVSCAILSMEAEQEVRRPTCFRIIQVCPKTCRRPCGRLEVWGQ